MKHSVLIVDDDVRLRELLQFVLEGYGYDILTCSDGKEAIQILEETAVEMIFLDMLMPKMDGFQTLPKIRSNKNHQSVPVILITGVYNYKEIKAGLDPAEKNYRILFKPLAVKRLKQFMSKYFDETKNIQYIFPDSVEKTTSFKKRISVDVEANVNVNDFDNRYFYVPMKGSIKNIRPGQLLHYVLHSGGYWNVSFESKTLNGNICIENGLCNGYWSTVSEDVRDMMFKEKVPLIGQLYKKKSQINPHLWISGRKASPFRRFIYKIFTLRSGLYKLEQIDTIPEPIKQIKPVSLSDIFAELVEGVFPDDLIHQVFTSRTEFLKVTKHISIVLQDLRWSEDYTDIIKSIMDNSNYQDFLSTYKIDKSSIMQNLMGMYLSGGVEISSRYSVKPVSTPKIKIDRRRNDNSHYYESKQSEVMKTTGNVFERFHYGCLGSYYDYLGVSQYIPQDELLDVIKSIKEEFSNIECKQNNTLFHAMKIKAFPLMLKEAASILTRQEDRNDYDVVFSLLDSSNRKQAIERHLEKGIVCVEGGSVYKGIARFKICIKLDAQCEAAFENLVKVLSQFKDYVAVTHEFCLEGLAVFPENLQIKIAQGRCFDQLKKQDKAIKIFKSIMIMDPSNAEAIQYLMQFPDQEKDILGL